MIRAFFVAWAFQAAVATVANAGGPYGTIHVGNWMGGADTDDSNGALSHCAAGSDYESGVSLIARLAATSSWLLGFASQRFDSNKDALPIDVTFDGQSQASLFATANRSIMVSAILPPNIARLPEGEPDGRGRRWHTLSIHPGLDRAAACSHRRKGELKAAEIAGAAGAYTLPISCTATEQAENAKR
jgi:hypothetical protein